LSRQVRRGAWLSAYLDQVKGLEKILLAAALAAILGPLAFAVSGVAGTGRDATAASDNRATVRVMDNFFDPRSVGVREGGKVKFLWKGTNRHNVRFTAVPHGASKKSSDKRRKGDWSRKFHKPGLYRYVCTLFSGMSGTVTVKPKTSGEG
jgi:plastocyanin